MKQELTVDLLLRQQERMCRELDALKIRRLCDEIAANNARVQLLAKALQKCLTALERHGKDYSLCNAAIIEAEDALAEAGIK